MEGILQIIIYVGVFLLGIGIGSMVKENSILRQHIAHKGGNCNGKNAEEDKEK